MKSSTQIRFDFQNAKNQANKLDELADNLEQQVVRKMSDTAQQLRAAWSGQSASRYLAKQAELQQEVVETVRALREIAEEIRRIAKRVYDAEMEALRIVLQKSGGGGR